MNLLWNFIQLGGKIIQNEERRRRRPWSCGRQNIMYGYLKMLRMFALHPELDSEERLRTTLMLRTADFVESQPFAIRIVILSYYFKGESWTAATSKIGAMNSTNVALKVCDACSDWDKSHVFI